MSDFLSIYDRAKAIVDACREGPAEFQELSREVWTLQMTIEQLSNDAQNPSSLLNRKGFVRRRELEQIIDSCKEALTEIEDFISRHEAMQDENGASFPRRVNSSLAQLSGWLC